MESLRQTFAADSRPKFQVVDLRRCNVFYMRGGSPHVFANMFQRFPRVMGVLSSSIRAGKILYMGAHECATFLLRMGIQRKVQGATATSRRCRNATVSCETNRSTMLSEGVHHQADSRLSSFMLKLW